MINHIPNDEPCYTISITARIVGIRAQTLRYYDRMGVITPSRSLGNRRMYSSKDVEMLKRIRTLMTDLGINLAGVDVVLRLLERLNNLEENVNKTDNTRSETTKEY